MYTFKMELHQQISKRKHRKTNATFSGIREIRQFLEGQNYAQLGYYNVLCISAINSETGRDDEEMKKIVNEFILNKGMASHIYIPMVGIIN